MRHEWSHAFSAPAEGVVHVDAWLEQAEAAHRLALRHEPAPRPLAS